MRLLILAIFLIGSSLSVQLTPDRPAHAADRFVPGTADVPLPAGLEVVDGSLTVFDTATGRVVEVFAANQQQNLDISGFYAETLPALGWRNVQGGWLREKERLDIVVDGATVRYTIRPAR